MDGPISAIAGRRFLPTYARASITGNRLAARIEERERIARDLHDSLFQDIQGLLLGFDNRANALPEQHPIRGALKELLRQSDRIMTNSRRRVLELRAEDPSQHSVAEALREVCADLAQINITEYRIVEIGAPMMLHPVVFEEAFHICREALINAFKHSGAKHIKAEICAGKRAFSVRIVDDGVGIDERMLAGDGRMGHFGLKGMAERAQKIGAKLTISSKFGSGTVVELMMSRSVAVGSRRERRERLW
jgi:signal transduction histidine kinase